VVYERSSLGFLTVCSIRAYVVLIGFNKESNFLQTKTEYYSVCIREDHRTGHMDFSPVLYHLVPAITSAGANMIIFGMSKHF
jgi:hypothetical protein